MSDAPASGGQPPLSPGEPRSFCNGRYVVQRRLGAGNFATVYLAHDDRLDVPVAVKLLSDRWSWDPEVRGRFVQEARLLRSLNDQRVVQIRDIAETDDGRPFLVMDFATEGTLEQRMHELAQRQVRPGPFQLRVVARAIADALAVLHERRIAHRDIKPSNMLITRSLGTRSPAGKGAGMPIEDAVLRPGERLMLGDLGLAKDLSFNSGITVGVGTAGYMAPEQMSGGGKIDVRSDIYAASALLAQLASGESPDPVWRVSSGRVEAGKPLPADIPPVLARALLRGLDANPDLRPQTIEQWLAEMDAALLTVETGRTFAPPAPASPTPSAPVATPATSSAPPQSPPAQSPPAQSPPAQSPPVVQQPQPAAAPVWSATSHGGAYGSGMPPAATTPARPRRTKQLAAAAVALVLVVVVAVVALSGDDDGGSGTTPSEILEGELEVDIDGPRRIVAGEQAFWEVSYTEDIVGGEWTLTGPVEPDPAEWEPGDRFRGEWRDPGRITLTLTAVDEDGNEATDSHTFVVEEP